MDLNREDNKLIFKNIPINQSITFIGLHRAKNSEEILFAIQKSKSKRGLKEHLRFEQKDADEIKSYLTKL